ncbi:hypothetical protein ID1000_12710 [Helicobacter pylori]
MSAGYQISEAVQMMKNTKAIQNLADQYDNLSGLLNQYNRLNSLANPGYPQKHESLLQTTSLILF